MSNRIRDEHFCHFIVTKSHRCCFVNTNYHLFLKFIHAKNDYHLNRQTNSPISYSSCQLKILIFKLFILIQGLENIFSSICNEKITYGMFFVSSREISRQTISSYYFLLRVVYFSILVIGYLY